ncbi:FAD-dependent monooxygenase [Sphaerisporangium fuscum]|uniref:FAD-dependent monooxygenase n=1 Tax=Sphaerisporangium fuscum TaxID=2835868 RepID=UPI001BDD029B|nr:FAD-dependent monooxygenase [Sphaerisporangium fuscum]
MSHAVVIGGGIGGLTAAIALGQKGWSVTLCERARSLEPIGSGLAIAPNALRALQTIGVGDEVRKLAALEGGTGLRAPDGRWFMHTDAATAQARFGEPIVVLLRPALVELLAARLAPDTLRLGTTVHAVDPGTGRVSTDDGDLDADLIVAADGIHSAVRRALFPAHPAPVHSGVTSWRVVVPRPEMDLRGSETWGAGTVFGIMPLAGDLVYCYATATLDRSGPKGGDQRDELLRLFGDWHDPIPRLLAAARPDGILRHDVFSSARPLPAFHQGRVALLGDAAHAMTPNMGQGACQAIEDAVVLAHVMEGGGTAGRLAAYTDARLPRTTKIVESSWNICRVTRWTNPLAVWARETLMSLAGRLPEELMLRRLDDVLSWRPPAS